MMRYAKAVSCSVPAGNTLYPALDGAYFAHCAVIHLSHAPVSALQAYRDMAMLVPGWFEALMGVRNRVMRMLGMKDLGRIDAAARGDDVRAGDKAGIFTVLGNAPNEIVLGDEDRHLRVALSLQLEHQGAATRLYCATVVERPNLLGRLYMLPVDPIHRLIVPYLLRRYARHLGNPSRIRTEDIP